MECYTVVEDVRVVQEALKLREYSKRQYSGGWCRAWCHGVNMSTGVKKSYFIRPHRAGCGDRGVARPQLLLRDTHFVC